MSLALYHAITMGCLHGLLVVFYIVFYIIYYIILSRASGVGSPTNHPGSGQRQDTHLWSIHRWTKPNIKMFKRRTDHTLDPYTLR